MGDLILEDLQEILTKLLRRRISCVKTNDVELDRRYAVLIARLELVIAYYRVFILDV